MTNGSRGRTPGYAAPEVVAGSPDFASEVFALAASLYFLLTRRLPFPGPSEAEMVRQIQCGLPQPDGCLEGVPRAVAELLRAGLQADPTRRPGLDEFREELRRMPMQVLASQLREQVRERPAARCLTARRPWPPGPGCGGRSRRLTSLRMGTESGGAAGGGTTGQQRVRYEVRADREGPT